MYIIIMSARNNFGGEKVRSFPIRTRMISQQVADGLAGTEAEFRAYQDDGRIGS